MTKLKLGPLRRFKSKTDTCPFEKLYIWAYKQTQSKLSETLYGEKTIPPNKVLNVPAFKLNPVDEQKFKMIMFEWLSKNGMPSQKKLEAMYSWINLDIGPGNTTEPPGYLYIDGDILIDRRGNNE